MLFDDYVAPEEEKDERVEESRDTVGEDLIPKTRKTIAVMRDLPCIKYHFYKVLHKLYTF
jgi:hypothetical protein